jgi:hypothetical protein
VLLLLPPASLLFACSRAGAAFGDLDRWLALPQEYGWILLGQILLWPALLGLFQLWRRFARPRSFLEPKKLLLAWGCTASVTLACAVAGGLYWPFRTYELRLALAEKAKAEMDLRELASECLSLVDNSNPPRWIFSPEPGELPPLIASLRPVWLKLTGDSVQILVVLRYFDPSGNEGFYFKKAGGVGSLYWYYASIDECDALVNAPLKDLRNGNSRDGKGGAAHSPPSAATRPPE